MDSEQSDVGGGEGLLVRVRSAGSNPCCFEISVEGMGALVKTGSGHARS